MKKRLGSMVLAGMIILFNPAVAVCSLSPVSPHLDSAIAQTGETAELPPPVTEGLALYKAGKVEAAVNQWTDDIIAFIKDLPVESEQAVAQQEETIKLFNQYRPSLIVMVTAVSTQYGPCKGYRVMKIIKRNTNTQSIYLDILHAKGSVFMEFITFRTEKGWAILHFHFSPDIEDIFK